MAFNREPVIVSRKGNENVVIVSKQEYNDLQQAKRNAEYLKKLDRSLEQLEHGEVVVKSMEELEHMAGEWFYFYQRSIWRLLVLADAG